MRRRLLCLTLLVLACAPAARADTLRLANDRVERTWSVDGGTVLGTGLRDVRTGAQWAVSGPDFAITVDEVPTTSALGWTLVDTKAGEGSLTLTYELAAGLRLVRAFTVHDGSPVVGVRSTLVNGTPAPVRIGAATLDQVTGKALAPAEVLEFHGGTDWRDDYRVASKPAGDFDVEGQVARFGDDAGWFLVSQVRGGAMWRAGRDADGRTWVGADWPRDVFDWGPLQSSPPDYNRVENPVYPLPVRERLVAPGATLELGTAFAGVYSGGAGEAGHAFGTHLAEHVAPRYERSIALSTWHPWSRGDGMSDQNLRRQVDRAKALGIERIMLDDQWQGGAGGDSGDWRFDPARFPDADGNGIPDFVEYVHAQGLSLGLWMSPLEFHPSSDAYNAHPEWACAPTGHVAAQIPDDAGLGVWNVNDPGFLAHISGVIDRLIEQLDVREFKFDFMAWVDCAPNDYLDYEQAWVDLVRELQREHPGVTIQLDETNDQRSWPFESAAIGPSWFDNGHLHGSTQTAKLLHDLWSAAPWLPTSSIGFGSLDGTLGDGHGIDELMAIALLGHVTFWTDLEKLGDADSARVAQWLGWYRAHRAALSAGAYELTGADPLDGRTWTVLQPWRDGRGMVFAFRQGSDEATKTVALHGLDPDTTYEVREALTGELVATTTGTLTIALPRDGAAVYDVQPRS